MVERMRNTNKPPGEGRIEDEATVATCGRCRKTYVLAWQPIFDDWPTTLEIAACDSGGVYLVETVCPHCELRTEL